MPEALPELVPLAVELLCFALVWTVRVLTAAIIGVIVGSIDRAHIPFVGAALSDAAHSIEQAVDNALGRVEHGIGAAVGATWHRLAQLNHWLWDEFKHHSLIGFLLSQEILLLRHAYHSLRNIAHGNTAAHAHDAARIKQLEREYHGIEAKIKTLENEYAKGIGADVLPRIKTLEREADHIQNVELPAAIAAQHDADSAISNLYDWAKGKASILGVGTFSVAVATALDVLGLGGLRCNKNPLKNKDCGSAVWDDLAGLLSLAAGALAVTNLEALLKDAEEIEVEVVNLARDVLGIG